MIANFDINAVEKLQSSLRNDVSQEILYSVNRVKKAVSSIQETMIETKDHIKRTDKNLEEKIKELEEAIKQTLAEIAKTDARLASLQTYAPESSTPALTPEQQKLEEQKKQVIEENKVIFNNLTNLKYSLINKLNILQDALEKCKSSKTACEQYMDKVDAYVADASNAMNSLDMTHRKLTEKVEKLCVKLDEAKTKIFEYQDIHPQIHGDFFRQRKKSKTGYFDVEKVQAYKKHIIKTSTALEKSIADVVKYHKSCEDWIDINFQKTEAVLEHTGKIIADMKVCLTDNTRVLSDQASKIEEYLSYAKKIK